MTEKSVKMLIKESGFRFDKRYGQNFISDTNLLRAIVEDAEIIESDKVLEIGTGGGALTAQLAQRASKVLSYEIDTALKPVLSNMINKYNNVEIIFADFLKIKPADIFARLGGDFKVVANLPYYITTPIIMMLLDNGLGSSITIMVQEEVAERLTAKEGKKEYGAITAQINLKAETKMLRKVAREMFFPQPNVDSAVINIRLSDKYSGKDKGLTQKIIKAAFAMRRKTLANNLASELNIKREIVTQAICAIGLLENIRGEMLSSDQFVQLSDYIYDEVCNENLS